MEKITGKNTRVVDSHRFQHRPLFATLAGKLRVGNTDQEFRRELIDIETIRRKTNITE